ncbi:MAG TPA: AMP-binding protein [Steroidobacter sp.]|nr:AMP-binding protein [Steroidobacter sp.]
MRTLDRPSPRVDVRRGEHGVVYVSCGIPYEPGLPSLNDYFERAKNLRPESTFLAERDGAGDWRRITYAEAWRHTGAIAAWFIRNSFGPDGPPVMILSENSIGHALLMLGALRAGAAVVPVSPTYSFGADLSRLRYALDLIQPGLVFAVDSARYAGALSLAAAQGRRTASGDDLDAWLRESDEEAVAEEAVARRRAQITDDVIAKILLTSGSTGRPKGVVNTHGNLAAGVQMIRLVTEPFTLERHHTIVDWLPWHHTFGGNVQFNSVLANAGTLYIDNGRPLPGMFQKTVENLRDISPIGFGCVPAVYGLLADALERDDDFRRKFFKNLRWLSYGGALLPQALWERMQRLAVRELGVRLPFGTGWGMTETSGTGLMVYWNTERSGLVGLPQPGVTLKLLPAGDRFELRMKGPHVMPRYHRDDALNVSAFDDEGFFRTGDAARWVDAERPLEGLEYAGRLAEDFKLLTGTWVQGSILRRDLAAALQPHVADLVICGPNQPWLGALVWLNPPDQPTLRVAIAEQLATFNRSRQGSADTIVRLLVLEEPPSPDAGEITDKRSINQARVLERRAADVRALYAETPDARVISPT